MAEIWKICPSWPDYEISDHGNVRRVVRRYGAFGPRKPYLSTTGYWYLVMRHRGDRKAVGVHHLVAEAFVGPQPSPDHEVAHGDGCKLNNAPSNLRWATHAENEQDKVLHGRSNRGERQGRSKLKAPEVLLIRQRLASGQDQETIAVAFGVARTTISSIAIGKSWAWLSGNEIARAAV